jgi:hypothetical protein
MNEYKFQEYNATGGRILPSISLGESGGFGVSAGFVKKYEIDSVVAAKIFYDQEKNAVAFKFSDKVEDGMLKVKLAPNQGGGYISAKEFLIKFDIDSKKFKGKYTPAQIDMPNIGKVFIIELKENTKVKA